MEKLSFLPPVYAKEFPRVFPCNGQHSRAGLGAEAPKEKRTYLSINLWDFEGGSQLLFDLFFNRSGQVEHVCKRKLMNQKKDLKIGLMDGISSQRRKEGTGS